MNPVACVLLGICALAALAIARLIYADWRRYREDRAEPRPRVTTFVSGPFNG